MKLRAFLALCLVTAGLSIVSGAAFFIAVGLVTGADQALHALKEPRSAVIAAGGSRQHRELGPSYSSAMLQQTLDVSTTGAINEACRRPEQRPC